MSEYIPIYQAAITISHSAPAMEANYGNQTIELSNLQNSELLKVDLGSPVLKECNTSDLVNFWFTFGNKWFRFHLSEMVLDKVATPLTNNFAYFEHQGLNIYKLYYRTNGYDKLIYFPKDLKIENYTGIIRELDDHTFYLSQDPTGKLITGIYDVPVVFDMKGLTINSTKEDRVSNIRIKEILFGEEVTPPQSLANPEVSILGGTLGSITPPDNPVIVTPNNLSGGILAQSPNVTTPADPVTINYVTRNDWTTGLQYSNKLTIVNNTPRTLTGVDSSFTVNTGYQDALQFCNWAQHLAPPTFVFWKHTFSVNAIFDFIPNATSFVNIFYRCAFQNGEYYFDTANSVSSNGGSPIVLKAVNTPVWELFTLSGSFGTVGSYPAFNPSNNFSCGWGVRSRVFHTDPNKTIKIDGTKTQLYDL